MAPTPTADTGIDLRDLVAMTDLWTLSSRNGDQTPKYSAHSSPSSSGSNSGATTPTQATTHAATLAAAATTGAKKDPWADMEWDELIAFAQGASRR